MYVDTHPNTQRIIQRGQFSKNTEYGLVGYWRFLGDAHDWSGHGKGGTPTAITWPSSGAPLGKCAHFDGSSSYIKLPAGSLLYSTFTIVMWLRDYGQATSSYDDSGCFSNFYAESAGYEGWFIRAQRWSTNGRWLLRVWKDGSLTSVGQDGIKWGDNRWHLGVFTRDGVSTITKAYWDGQLIDMRKAPMGLPANTRYPAFGARIGATTSYFWRGEQAEVKFYNRVLSEGEIRQLYQLGTNRVGLKNYLTASALQQFYQTISVIETPVVGLTKQSSLKRLISVVENSIVNLSRVASLKRLISVSETAVVSLKRGFFKTISVVETAVVSLTAVKMFFKTISVIENSVVSLSRRANLSRLISVVEAPIISLTKFKAVRRTIAVVENAVVSLSKVRRIYRTISVVEIAVVSIAKKGWWRTIKHTANWIFKDKH